MSRSSSNVAGKTSEVRTLDLAAECHIELAQGPDGTPAPGSLPRFRMVAYTGGTMKVAGWRYPVIVDLAGLAIPSQSRPIRFGHDAASGVGHTDAIRIEASSAGSPSGGPSTGSGQARLVATGVVSRVTPAAQEVVASSRNGFPWQASIGASVEEFEFVRENQKVTVNGRTFDGPVNVVRRSTLGEISFVDLGADGNTSADVAARAAREKDMPEQQQDSNGAANQDAVKIEAQQPKSGSGDASGGVSPDIFITAARQERLRKERITALVQ